MCTLYYKSREGDRVHLSLLLYYVCLFFSSEFLEGPWEVRVLVDRCFLTLSNSRKKHILHADLRILKVPRDVQFIKGPKPKTIPFAGYIKLPSKYHG